MQDYARPIVQTKPHEPRASSIKVDDDEEAEDDSFQRHMSVLDETIGSQRVEDEEIIIAMADDYHGTHGTQLTKSDAWYANKGTTEPKKNRRIAQQSSRKKGFPGTYSTPIGLAPRKDYDPFYKTHAQP